MVRSTVVLKEATGLRCVLLALALCLAGSAWQARAAAPADAFLRHRPYDPLTATLGLPAAAARLSADEHHLQVALEHGNIFTGGRDSVEALRLDGETSRLALRYASPLSACVGIDVAGEWLYHGGGVFDRAIDDWHQWFGLPDAGRDQSTMFELDFSYVNADGREISVAGSAQGPGDLSVAVQRSWRCNDANSSLWRVGVKLPTGNAARLLGSGHTDVFADVQLPWYRPGTTVAARRWSFGAIAGLLRPAQVASYPDQRLVVGYGTLAARYRWGPSLQLLAQLDGRTPVFDSTLVELGGASLVFSAGFRSQLQGDTVEVTIAEDAVIDTAPDIVLRLGWTRRYP